MGYCALLVPQDIKKTPSTLGGVIQKATGKLMSGLKSGGLNFENATTVLKDTASLISEGVDTVANKFSGIALTQLLVDGKVTSKTALDYLTQGFPQALGMTAVTQGFQSVEQLKTALKSQNGVNVQQVIKSFQNFGSALSNVNKANKVRQNIDGYDTIEIDATLNDKRTYEAETPDRRVESGQTFQEFIHNMPETFSLTCLLQEGRNYTSDDFEDMLVTIRNRKIAINVILGDTVKKSFALQSFTPARSSKAGLEYDLEFKKITVGEVQMVPLSGKAVSSIRGIVSNALNPNDTKTNSLKSLGQIRAKQATDNFKKSFKEVFL